MPAGPLFFSLADADAKRGFQQAALNSTHRPGANGTNQARRAGCRCTARCACQKARKRTQGFDSHTAPFAFMAKLGRARVLRAPQPTRQSQPRAPLEEEGVGQSEA